ncbi:MAG: hypothetical protein ACOC1F_07410, partial [Myxococcota bacterium]
AALWFGEGKRQGIYRPRTVEEVVQASRPWRARIAAIAGHAFVFEPDLAVLFEDVNSTGTIDEEKGDLRGMNALVRQHEDRLTEYGLTPELITEGETLLEEAEERDMAGILGVRDQADALVLRDQLLTYAVALGREARAAGINACFHDDQARKRFEKASFRNALRRLRGRRRRAAEDKGEGGSAPSTDPFEDR